MSADKYDVLWNTVVERIKTYENIDASQIDAFFSRLVPQAFSEGFLMLTSDTEFIKKWIESHYTDVIKQALEEIYQVPFTIAIEVDTPSSAAEGVQQDQQNDVTHTTSQHTSQQSEPSVKSLNERGSQSPFSPVSNNHSVSPFTPTAEETISHNQDFLNSVISGYSFESFVIGTSNKMAYSMAVAVAETPGQPQFNPLFIYGKSGLGKTHLLRSIQNYVHHAYPTAKTVYVDTMALVNDYTDAAISRSNKSFSQFKQKYETADVLLIDDVQGLQNKKETLNMVFQILNSMIDRGKQVVFSADRAPKNIDIDERYMSRFNMGGTCDIQPPELETKLGIIKNYLEECRRGANDDFSIPADVQEYIAQNSSSNIRELKSAVTKVVFELRNNGKSEITIDEAARLLTDHFSGGAMKRLSISDIQTAVEQYYNVSHTELVGRKRSANITYARQIAIYLCRTMIDIPFNSIGTEFNRDHSTIMYSFRSVEEKVKESRQVNEELEIIRQMIIEQ